MIRIIILGASGSMGRLIGKLALEDDEIEVVAACDIIDIGKEFGILCGANDSNKIKITDASKLQEIIKSAKPEVAIDFTIAEAAENNCKICVKNKIRCVIGTTALSQDFLDEHERLIEDYNAPAVISPNMAIGMNVFFKIASILTQYLADWDIEVIEAHHNRKKDAPSGTLLTITEIISRTLAVKMNDVVKYGRSRGPNKRKVGAKNEIGVHAIRAGDIVGDHMILFAGSGERIEFKHQAHSRMCFASGAIRAIKFIVEAKENKIYKMQDVLSL